MDYTPAMVDYWVRNFELLSSLAESPSTSAHLLSSECRQSDHACANGKPVGIKATRSHGDPTRYIDVLADIQAAAQQLPPFSLESQVVASRIRTGGKLSIIARLCSVRYDDALSAYRRGVKAMAMTLGWVEVDGNPEQC